jgi:glutathione peroxidase
MIIGNKIAKACILTAIALVMLGRPSHAAPQAKPQVSNQSVPAGQQPSSLSLQPPPPESVEAVPPAPESKAAETAYVFSFAGLLGGEVKLDDYAGRPMLIVNTASKCGFTPQYEGLEKLWNAYKDRGLVVIGIPSNDFGGQEPGDAADIKKFCDLTYGVNFPMTAKQVVKGKDAHPFYQWAKASYGGSAVPKWNFHKILIGVDGTVVDTWSSMTGPSSNDIKKAVERELAKSTPAGTVEEE